MIVQVQSHNLVLKKTNWSVIADEILSFYFQKELKLVFLSWEKHEENGSK